jgi:hypothetical protein
MLSPSSLPYNYYLGPANTQGSIAQALDDLGFRDLAEELAELFKEETKLDLTWESTIEDASSLRAVAANALNRVHPGLTRTRAAAKKSYRMRFQVTLSFDHLSNEIEVERLFASGLWEDLGLMVVSRKHSGAQLEDFARARAPIAPSRENSKYLASWAWKGEMISFGEIGGRISASRKRGADTKGSKNQIQDWTNTIIGSLLAQRAFQALPRLSYIGPVRVADDRNYSVATDRMRSTVGRNGELTWVQLQQGFADPESRKRLEKSAKEVLGLSDVLSSREGIMRPRVTLRIGKKAFPLHSFGLGTSQVLPILVQLSIPSTNQGSQLLIVEEPESHLHPAAQKALGIAFADFVLRGGMLIVETHSEIILRAIQLRMVEEPRLVTSCIVNWVDMRDPDSSLRTRTLQFDKEGKLQGELPPTLDQVVPELIEDRLLRAGD